MNQKQIRKVLFITAVALLSFVAMAATPQTFTGDVSETMCKAKHMLPGKTAVECTLQCVKSGSKFALVAGKKVYTLSGANEELTKFAGKRVRLTGERSGDTIQVQKVTPSDQ